LPLTISGCKCRPKGPERWGRSNEAKIINDVQKITSRSLKASLLENRAALLRFLNARGTTREEAEDLLQDLFVKLESQNLGTVNESRAYLYRMANNLLVDRRRAAMRRSGREAAWFAAGAATIRDADDAPTVEKSLIDRQRLTIVSEALAELPERTVWIFKRFRIDGVPQRQIASDLGISISAVEKHLQRVYRVLVEVRATLDAENERPWRP
jgi:RNA polymerase sigma factor (sigma-70 family)